MSLLKPRYSPIFLPFGATEDVTPFKGLSNDAEALFNSENGVGNPKVKIQGRYQVWFYFGTGFSLGPKVMYFYYSNDGAESWKNNNATFASDELVDEALIDSTYLSSRLWLEVPTWSDPNRVLMNTYKSDDKGTTWDFQWTITPAYPIGTHRIFPTSKGIFQVMTIGDDSHAKLVGYKDGDLVLDNDVNIDTNLYGIIVSTYNEKYEQGYFNRADTGFDGGDDIWRVNGSGFTKLSTLPVESTPLLQEIFYIPEKDTVMAYGQAYSTPHIYLSHDGGSTWHSIPAPVRINCPEFTFLKSQEIVQSYGSGHHGRTDGYFSNITHTVDYENILKSIDSGGTGDDVNRWHHGFPFKLWRRQSRMLLWKLINP